MQPVRRKKTPTVVAVSEELQWQRVGRLRGRRENCATAMEMEKGKANTVSRQTGRRGAEQTPQRYSFRLFSDGDTCSVYLLYHRARSPEGRRSLSFDVMLARLGILGATVSWNGRRWRLADTGGLSESLSPWVETKPHPPQIVVFFFCLIANLR